MESQRVFFAAQVVYSHLFFRVRFFFSKASNSFSEVGVGSALDPETQAEKGDLLDFLCVCLLFIIYNKHKHDIYIYI